MTPEARKQLLEALDGIVDWIEAASNASPLGGIPSGELYAILMGKIDIHTYQTVIGVLQQEGYITVKNHLLKSTGKIRGGAART